MGRPAGIATLRYFAEHWRKRSAEFRQADFGMAIRYEDFISNKEYRQKLISYLEIDIPPANDFTQSSRVDWESADKSKLSFTERYLLGKWLADEIKKWKY